MGIWSSPDIYQQRKIKEAQQISKQLTCLKRLRLLSVTSTTLHAPHAKNIFLRMKLAIRCALYACSIQYVVYGPRCVLSKEIILMIMFHYTTDLSLNLAF